ncbi:MAG TPA: hypothetical protein VL251_09150 [Thermomonas sp.]|nr:hypothetical protein [Thermomonas sp.]
MTRPTPLLPRLLAIAVLAVLPALSAQASPQAKGRGQQQDRDSRSTLSDAVRRVERDTRGEVLSAERVQYDGRDMHRVKVVDDQGRVRVFMQDPRRRDDARDGGSRGDGRPERPRPTRGDDD